MQSVAPLEAEVTKTLFKQQFVIPDEPNKSEVNADPLFEDMIVFL